VNPGIRGEKPAANLIYGTAFWKCHTLTKVELILAFNSFDNEFHFRKTVFSVRSSYPPEIHDKFDIPFFHEAAHIA
jgi:hypothetical protein